MRERTDCQVVLPYPLYEGLKRLLIAHDTTITAEDFGAEVTLCFDLISEELPPLQDHVTEFSAGALHIQLLGVRYAPCAM